MCSLLYLFLYYCCIIVSSNCQAPSIWFQTLIQIVTCTVYIMMKKERHSYIVASKNIATRHPPECKYLSKIFFSWPSRKAITTFVWLFAYDSNQWMLSTSEKAPFLQKHSFQPSKAVFSSICDYNGANWQQQLSMSEMMSSNTWLYFVACIYES